MDRNVASHIRTLWRLIIKNIKQVSRYQEATQANIQNFRFEKHSNILFSKITTLFLGKAAK